jgi:hypothetical protein
MRILARVLLGIFFILALARVFVFEEYVRLHIWSPYDTHHLEAAMVHLAWRVQHGVRLYPDWEHYPHVANFYSPLSFLAIGAVGRALSTTIEGLYAIGRCATLASVLLTSLVIGVVIARRYGIVAAVVGVLLSMGVGPLYSAGVMTRPDAPAELLGILGFFLAGGQKSITRVIGGVLLYLAAMTKQTALAYLLAALLGLYLEGRGKQARNIFMGVAPALLLTVLVVQFAVEPNFVRCLLGESRTPIDFATWWDATATISIVDPEFIILTLAGVALWSRGARKEPMLTMLAVVLFAACFLSAAKRGSAQNYFLGMRSVAALAGGALWQSIARATRPRVWEMVTVAILAYGLVKSSRIGLAFVLDAAEQARMNASDYGKAADSVYRGLYAALADPRKRIFTDSGMLDIRQGERTVFGDPYRFRLMVECGLIDPILIQKRIEDQYYELLICREDLFAPEYETYDFGMPRPLYERARVRYKPIGANYGLHYYTPRLTKPAVRAGTGQ